LKKQKNLRRNGKVLLKKKKASKSGSAKTESATTSILFIKQRDSITQKTFASTILATLVMICDLMLLKFRWSENRQMEKTQTILQ